jgi:serine protease AprX
LVQRRRDKWGIALSIVLAAGHAHAGDQTPSLVRLKYAQFDPLAALPLVEPTLAALDWGDPGLYLVQFRESPTEAGRELIRAAGGTVGPFLTDSTYLVKIDQLGAARVAKIPEVRWVGPYLAAYRMSREVRVDALAGAADGGALRYSIQLFERGAGPQNQVADRLIGARAIIDERVPQGMRMEATLTPAQVRMVATMPEVVYIERATTPGSDMTLARTVSGATPYLSGLGFSGQGVRGQVTDDGIRASHTAFQASPVIFYGPVPSVEFHGTATYAISFASGAGNADSAGVVSSGQGIFLGYEQLTDWGGSVTRYTAVADLVNPALSWKGVYQLSAWGGGLTTEYTTESAEIDDIVFLHDLIIAQSQSNTGSQMSRPQAWGKNVVSVGGVNLAGTSTFADDLTDSASFGPAEDGRMKPELTHSYNDATTPCDGSNNCFGSFGGTSAASSIVAGMYGLVHQMWHQGVWAGFGGASSVFASRPHSVTARALVISGTHQYNWTAGGPNATLTRAQQGWGLPNLQNIHAVAPRTFIVNATDPVQQGQTLSYQVQVAAGEPYLRAVMVYMDPAGNPAAAQARVNDLDLRVIPPVGPSYWGNAGLNAGVWSTTGGAADTINTVECVFVQNPSAGLWTIEVTGSQVVQDGHTGTPAVDATFGLVVAGASGGLQFTDIPGLAQAITVPASGGLVLISTDGGFVSASSSAASFIDVRLNVNGSPLAGGLRRVCVGGTSSTTEPHGVWSMNRVISLPPGEHTIKVQAAKVNGTGAVTSGPSGSVYQSSLSVSLIKP